MPWVQGYPWSNEITLEFIKQYGKEPCLWDPKNPKHKNRAELFYAWERIRNALKHHYDYSIDDLKRKKEALLTSFRLHVRRKQKNPKHAPIWFCYEALERFLGPIYFGDEKEITKTRISNDANSRATNVVTRPSTSNSDHSATLQNIKREFEHETPRTSMNSNYTDTSDQIEEFDECDLFAKLVARKLRRLNQHDRDIVMHEIDNLMFDATRKYHTADLSEFAITVKDHKVEENFDDEEYLEEHVEE